MSRPSSDEPQKTSDHIDQIRDIIIGPQRREMDQRLERISTEIRKSSDAQAASLEEARTALHGEIGAVIRSLQQMRAEMEKEMAAGMQSLKTAHDQLHQELDAAKAKLLTDIRTMREQLAAETERSVAALRDSSVPRDVLAELLQEMAVRLRTDDVLEDLRKATGSGKGT